MVYTHRSIHVDECDIESLKNKGYKPKSLWRSIVDYIMDIEVVGA